ncbi:MAG: hypothetical protein IT480_02385 [Gammaproteobacteria bacterium]|nr:hypothetical protein [Gammaproteobacteria bacterium]
MSRASDILRWSAEHQADKGGSHCALENATVEAIADLLEATAAYIAWTEGAGHGESGHDAWLLMRNALAAAERAVTGEGNASER